MTEYDATFKYTAEYLRGMDNESLDGFVTAAQKVRHELRMQNAEYRGIWGPVPSDIWKKIRTDIARAMTIINERR